MFRNPTAATAWVILYRSCAVSLNAARGAVSEGTFVHLCGYRARRLRYPTLNLLRWCVLGIALPDNVDEGFQRFASNTVAAQSPNCSPKTRTLQRDSCPASSGHLCIHSSSPRQDRSSQIHSSRKARTGNTSFYATPLSHETRSAGCSPDNPGVRSSIQSWGALAGPTTQVVNRDRALDSAALETTWRVWKFRWNMRRLASRFLLWYHYALRRSMCGWILGWSTFMCMPLGYCRLPQS